MKDPIIFCLWIWPALAILLFPVGIPKEQIRSFANFSGSIITAGIYSFLIYCLIMAVKGGFGV